MPERTCTQEDCVRKHYARGYCRAHYRKLPDQQAKEREYYAAPEVQAQRRAVDKKRQRRPYQRAWEDARKDWGAWWERHRRSDDLLDLKAWQHRQERRQRKVTLATRPLAGPRQFIAGTCPDCGEPVVVVRGWWHDSIRCPSCTKRRWRGSHKQRAKMRGVEYEDINPAVVFARDKRRCQICGNKTRGKYPAPTSASIDHITPLSRGGPPLAA